MNSKIGMFIVKVALVLCTIMSPCVEAECYSLPKWYLNPPRDDQNKLYGVGQGITVDGAAKEALNQIASRLSITVSSNWEKTERQAAQSGSNSYSKEISNNLKTRVAAIRFNNYEILDNEIADQDAYVLVAVDKKTLLSDKKNDLSGADFEIESIYEAAKGKSVIVKIADLRSVSRKISQTLPLLSLISSLDPSFEAQKYFDKYNRYLASERNVLSEVRVFLVPTRDSGDLVPIIKEHLNNANIAISERQDDDKNTVKVVISTDARKMQIYGSNMVKLFTKFEVKDASDVLVASSKIESKGSSMISLDEAGKAAALELDAKIKEIGILNALGISKDSN